MFKPRRPKPIFSKRERNIRLPVSLILLILLVALFWLIPTGDDLPQEGYVPGTFTPVPTLPTDTATPEPTKTMLPKPSSEARGGRIIFTCTRGDYNQLCMVNRDGSGLFRLTNHNAHDYYPSFAPQGGAIVFSSSRNGFFDLYLFILNTSTLHQLTNRIGNAFSPDFSPDGEQIVFGNRVEGGPSSLWIATRTGDNPRLLYAGEQSIVAAAWSPNGKTIAFAMSINALQNEFDVFLLDADGTGQPRRLNTGLLGISGSLDWSPESRYLLIVAGPFGDKDVFRYDIETGHILRLTAGGNNNSATYSPDGEYIAFNSLRNKGQADIYIMRADGSQETQVTDHPEPDWQPQWEP
ncbi:MAG: hypothetical protein Kow002_19620 [Anaerolineales bacterium]